MIGQDFPKIEFKMFGLELLEPMGVLLDFVLSVVSFYLAYKVLKFHFKNQFYATWHKFYVIFGLATLFGALGHGLYNYFGFYGMFPSWLLIPVAIFYIESAVINAHKNQKTKQVFKKIYKVKLVLLYVVFTLIYLNGPIVEKPSLLFLPIAINTILGLFVGVGYFGYTLFKNQSVNFKYLVVGILVIFPSSFIFLMKINIHPWFNKNDFSHLLMILGLICFYISVNKLQKEKFTI